MWLVWFARYYLQWIIVGIVVFVVNLIDSARLRLLVMNLFFELLPLQSIWLVRSFENVLDEYFPICYFCNIVIHSIGSVRLKISQTSISPNCCVCNKSDCLRPFENICNGVVPGLLFLLSIWLVSFARNYLQWIFVRIVVFVVNWIGSARVKRLVMNMILESLFLQSVWLVRSFGNVLVIISRFATFVIM